MFGAFTITFTSAAICAPEDSKSHESLEGGHLETFSDQSNIGQSLRYNAGVGIAFISQRKLQFEINYIRGEENVPNIELKKTTVVLALAIAASVSANMLGTVGAQGLKTAIPTLSPTQSQSPTSTWCVRC
ncbi:hypothetical protein BH20ACI3_BH20ACI3_26010 [soil metagenome]